MTLTRLERCSSSDLIDKILGVCFPDATTVLDATVGKGNFWKTVPDGITVTGMDIDRSRKPDLVGDFMHLPFRDDAFDVAVFDPPYLTDNGEDSMMRSRFGSYPSVGDLRVATMMGTYEAWRVARVGVIVKTMTYIHASRLVRMPTWVEASIGTDLYDEVYLESPSKVQDRRWTEKGNQLSVRSNATHWMIFRKDGPVHTRRRTAPC